MINDKARRSVIQFEDVSFEYPGAETESIHHISLDIKKGEFLVLTGGSGCGKTTLTPAADIPKQNICIDTVTAIDYAVNTVVIKCHNGMAQAACAALDSMKYENIVGTIAGDDTIFVLMRTESDADNLVKTFKKLIWG